MSHYSQWRCAIRQWRTHAKPTSGIATSVLHRRATGSPIPRKSTRRQEPRMEQAKHFIGNQWVRAAGGETIPVVDPSDGQVFTELARGNAADIDRAVTSARRAYEGAWG